MTSAATSSSFNGAAKALAPQIEAAADEIERSRQLPDTLVDALAQAGLFRLWTPRALGGEEVDPMTLVRVVEEISRVDGAVGWCAGIGGAYAMFGGYLPAEAAGEIYGSDPLIRTAGAFRPAGNAVVVDGGYRVTGRWPLGSGCQHSQWIVGGCRILDGDQPRVSRDGTPITRILFFPAADCEILDTWYSIGLRGTGSHDYAVREVFVPASRSLSFREPPTDPGPLYAMPTVALFCTVLAAVPLGIARHAIDIVCARARTKFTLRSRGMLGDDTMMQTNLGTAEALLHSARAFLYQALEEVWEDACAAKKPGVAQRAKLWLASTHAATAAKQAADLMFTAASSAAPYAGNGIERCVRDIYAASQHLALAPANYQMVGQAFLGLDMQSSWLLSLDDRSGRGAHH
jgi:alkylation response protein AidB-like acyl-CoA dehydrogenase